MEKGMIKCPLKKIIEIVTLKNKVLERLSKFIKARGEHIGY